MAPGLQNQPYMFNRLLSLISIVFTVSTVYAVDTRTNLNQVSISRIEMIKKLDQSNKLILTTRPNPPSFSEYLNKIKIEKSDNGGWGGGTIVLRGQQSPILYDLYMADPQYQETFNITPNLAETDFLKAMGYEYFKLQDMAEYPYLLARLEKWRPKANGLVNLILQSLKSIEVSYTTTPLIRIDGLKETAALEAGHTLEPVILFNRVMNLRLYLPYWKRMGDQSRLAALVHEAFRNIQIVAEFKNNESDFDLKIQKITQFLIMNEPSELAEHLDYTQFFDGELLQYLLSAESASLNLLEYATLYHPEYLKDPKIKQRLTDPARNEEFMKNQSKLSQKSMFEDRIKLYKMNDKYPVLNEAIEKTEAFIRAFLKNPREFSPLDRFEAETFMKGLHLQNMYMQERWMDESSIELAMDIKKLMFLQLKFPRIDIFGQIQKYGCLTTAHWLTPVEKMQSRESTKMMDLHEKENNQRMQCIQKIFEDNPTMLYEYLRILVK